MTTRGTKKGRPTGKAAPPGTAKGEVGVLRHQLGLSRKVFSRLTGFSERALAGWEAGAAISGSALRRIRELERFQKRLAEVVRPEFISTWLETPNDAFDGFKPLEVIERGEIDRLWDMIFYLESGIVS